MRSVECDEGGPRMGERRSWRDYAVGSGSEMAGGIHAGMQDANDQHAGFALKVEDDMGAVLETPQIGRKVFGAAAQSRVCRKISEAGFEAVAIAPRLLDTQGFDRVVGDLGEVGFCKGGEAVVSHGA